MNRITALWLLQEDSGTLGGNYHLVYRTSPTIVMLIAPRPDSLQFVLSNPKPIVVFRLLAFETGNYLCCCHADVLCSRIGVVVVKNTLSTCTFLNNTSGLILNSLQTQHAPAHHSCYIRETHIYSSLKSS